MYQNAIQTRYGDVSAKAFQCIFALPMLALWNQLWLEPLQWICKYLKAGSTRSFRGFSIYQSTLDPEWKELGTLHFHHVGEKQSRQSCACKPLQSSSLHLRHGTNATATIGPFRRLHNPYSLLDRCHVLVRFLRVGTKDVTTHIS